MVWSFYSFIIIPSHIISKPRAGGYYFLVSCPDHTPRGVVWARDLETNYFLGRYGTGRDGPVPATNFRDGSSSTAIASTEYSYS